MDNNRTVQIHAGDRIVAGSLILRAEESASAVEQDPRFQSYAAVNFRCAAAVEQPSDVFGKRCPKDGNRLQSPGFCPAPHWPSLDAGGARCACHSSYVEMPADFRWHARSGDVIPLCAECCSVWHSEAATLPPHHLMQAIKVVSR
jgi:hypothetical protein